MSNEEFQELVLKQLQTLTEGQQDLRDRFNRVEIRLDNIEGKLDAVYDQTAVLTEFKTSLELKKNIKSI